MSAPWYLSGRRALAVCMTAGWIMTVAPLDSPSACPTTPSRSVVEPRTPLPAAFVSAPADPSIPVVDIDTGVEQVAASPKTRLGIHESRFTINDQPVFLFGISYYAALGANEQIWQADLEDMQRLGVRWLRVWATWSAFDDDVSVVDHEGRARPQYLRRLERLVQLCDQRGLVVDVTLSRQKPLEREAFFASPAAYHQAALTVVQTLRPYRNWYLDLANERNIRDRRFVSFDDLAAVVRAVRRVDPARLLTASHAGELSATDVRGYLHDAGLDFLAVHVPRQPQQPARTALQTRQYLQWMRTNKRLAPVHYQEPFRRDFGHWQPTMDDFLDDLRGALEGGAAGWCFHTGDNRAAADRQPRRCFDLRRHRLFTQLDDVEQQVLPRLAKIVQSHSPIPNQKPPP